MEKIRLSGIDTDAPSHFKKEETQDKTRKMVGEIGRIAKSVFAEKKHSILVVLQGMDASGKDGTAQNVFADCPVLSIDAFSFKKPTEEEFAHDFLWRVHRQVPAKGNIKIFIRSHYEDILIQSVHQWIDDERVEQRMKAINAFEELLNFDNHTTILKFYLHISHSRQMEKLEERRQNPDKQWKYNEQDLEESKLWDKYMKAYEFALNHSKIPWHIIPADQNWYRDHAVATIVLEQLKKLKSKFPTLDDLE